MLDRTSTKEYHFTVKSLHKAGKRTGVENTNFISFNLSAGTSIDNFNAKMKVVILQQRHDWEPPQIKDLKLVIPKDYTFMASNTIFIALGIQDKYLEKTMLISLLYPLAHTKHLLIHHLLQYHCHCTASKSTKSKTSRMDNHQICWPACMFLIIKELFLHPFSLLELDIDQPHLDFDENNNEVIPRTLHLQLLNKQWVYTTMKPKFIQI